MAIELPSAIVQLLQDPATVRVLATVDPTGFPHAVVKKSLHLGEDGNLVYLELLESSRTNRNLVASLWFDRRIAIVVSGRDGASWQIKGRPIKVHIAGPYFRRYYEETRRDLPEADLAGVWIIEPEEVINEAFGFRRAEEEEKHPFFGHLDKLAFGI